MKTILGMGSVEAEQLAASAGLRPKTRAKFRLPVDHQPGMKVPKGGSLCASCKHLGDASGPASCQHEMFREWNGSSAIPGDDPSSYCSDWYEPRQ